MPTLTQLYREQGFQNVISYIQSGNVVFDTPKRFSPVNLARRIEDFIGAQFGFQVPVLVRTLDEMKRTVSVNPFLKVKGIQPDKLYVTFLSELPAEERTEAISQVEGSSDRFVIIGKDVFLYCPGGYGKTRLSNNFFENKLGVSATTRNWKTVNMLLELAAVR